MIDVQSANALIEAGRGWEVPALLDDAANAGNAGAAHMLAILLARGAFIPKDWPRALELLAQAAALGSVEARIELDLTSPHGSLERLFAAPTPVSLCDAPRIRRIDDFLTPRICDYLIERGRNSLRPAATLERDETAGRVRRISEHRTNSALPISLFDGGVLIALIAERIARAVDVPTSVFEAPQLFHYATGQEFQLHIDYIEGAAAQRMVTFLVYLNDEFEGGETWFPLADDLKVKPARGGAIYFHNVDLQNQPDPMTVHAGTAPTQGEKWLLSQWIRDRPYTGD